MPTSTFLFALSLLTPYAIAQATGPAPPPVCANPDATCSTYGIDFQNGHSYFQNTGSSDPFTFVSQFTGCANDVAQNILVDPSGRQYTCSNTSLTPDSTSQLSTCNELKSSLYSGEWGIILISNNGGCAPLNAYRAIDITAAPQSTITYTPTMTLTSTTTPVVTVTSTDVVTTTITAGSSTTYQPRGQAPWPGWGWNPWNPPHKRGDPRLAPRTDAAAATSVTTTTTTLSTATVTSSAIEVASHSTVTSTAQCVVPDRAAFPDPLNRIIPTVVPNAIQEIVSLAIDLLPRDAAPAPTSAPSLADSAIKAKRAPDEPTITVTDTNSDDFSTTTSTVTAIPPITTTTAVTSTTTVTVQPASSSYQTTSTCIKEIKPVVTSRFTYTATPKVTIGYTPAGASASCTQKGGILNLDL